MLGFSADEWTAILLSLRVATVATLVALPLAVFAAYALARWRFPGKFVLDSVLHLPLVLPPVVTGYLLLLTFGRQGAVGAGGVGERGLTGGVPGAAEEAATDDRFSNGKRKGVVADRAENRFGVAPKSARAAITSPAWKRRKSSARSAALA